MADKKVSELDAITGTDTAADDLFLIVDTSGAVTKKITRAELNNAIEQDVLSSIEITDITNDVNIQGTVTADGLTVDSDSATATIKAFQPKFILDDDSAAGAGSDKLIIQSAASQSDGDYEFVLNNDQTSSADRTAMKIKGNGDVSLYASDGTTQGLYWDASTQRLGLGTTGPTNPLHISSSAGEAILISNSSASGNSQIKLDGATDFQIGTGQASSGFANKLFIYDATNAATRMVITDGGNVGIGINNPVNKLALPNNNYLAWQNNAGSSETIAIRANTSDGLEFLTGSTRMTITSGGAVGIGESNPLSSLHIDATNGAENFIRLHDGDSDYGAALGLGSTGDFVITAIHGGTATEALRVDRPTGNVGIGTASPSEVLTVAASASNARISITDTDSLKSAMVGLVEFDGTDGRNGYIGPVDGNMTINTDGGYPIKFQVTGSERGRWDTSGNFLVGKTTTALGTNGVRLANNDTSNMTVNGGAVLDLNRRTSDGSILGFYKDGTSVGSIGVSGSKMFITTGNAGVKFRDDLTAIIPCNSDGSNSDDDLDWGYSSVRWDDIYATNGTIQTSDANEKNTIADSDLGLDFINRLEPKSYVFNGKTRTHYGLIAQDVETVLGDISKPTSGFAGFIKSDISEEQDGSEYRYGLRYTEFVGPLIKALQEADAKIEALEARIAALEGA